MESTGRMIAVCLACTLAPACNGSDSKATTKETTMRRPAPTAPAVSAYAAGRSQPVRDDVYPQYGNPSIDVLHYGLDLTWNPGKRRLSGTATLTVRATKSTEKISLDLGKSLKATSVTVGGAAARARHKGEKLTIPAGRTLARDEAVPVVIRYGGKLSAVAGPGGRGFTGARGARAGKGGVATSPLQEPYGAFTWYPVNDHPSDEALYDTSITVPKGWSAVTSGTFAGQTRQGASSVFRWQSTDPVASYVTTLGIDRYTKTEQKGPRGLPLTYWVRAKDRKSTLKTLKKSPAMLRWLEKYLGPYPYPTGGVVIMDNAGMETQQMISLFPKTPGFVLVHEYAHHWFGNTVTNRTWSDMWLNEGPVTYMQFLYMDHTGEKKLSTMMREIRRKDQQYRDLAGPPGKYKKAYFADLNVYDSPALMLHEIRGKAGDKKFWAMMRGWAQEHRNTTQDRKTFIAWVNQSTGKDFTKMINKWLLSSKTPR